ncbi:MAG: S8 family serine peptidase [Betaproteobacteria bacterium]
MSRFGFGTLAVALVFAIGAAGGSAQAASRSAAAKLPAPVVDQSGPAGPDTGRSDVIVRLKDKPLIAMLGDNARRTGIKWTGAQQRAYLAQLKSKQDALMQQIAAKGGSELARVGKGHNALVVNVETRKLAEIAALPGVDKLRAVVHYRMDLSETVPYVGATALQQAGTTGAGRVVAVLDSGIDYTHRNLGGSGLVSDYLAAHGAVANDPKQATRDGLFPTAKVIEGFDFVGEVWPNGPRAEDNDPIDFQGHGTHVADIIAGESLDGTHKGVAPGAKLIAVRVCSAVATSCNGVSLLLGIDYVLDPNGDGDLSDAVDVVNLSLGSAYGQREDDLSEALALVSRFGVVVVAAAGNDADKPYIVSSPSATPEVISVAQTQVPSAVGYPLVVTAPASIAGIYGNTATVDWAPVSSAVSGDVVFVGNACPGDTLLANPAGKIALIDRGICSVSLKVDQAGLAGAKGALIGLIAPGDAVSFSNGGGSHFVPTLVIQQSLSSAIKGRLSAAQTVSVAYGGTNAVPLVGSMASTSARGPGFSYVQIKPDLGAPGASVSAVVGTGNQEEAFGGTSGATPMVSGAAALLLQRTPSASPAEIKARLMNAANTQIYTNPALLPGVLAPITRIGAGELRVDRSAALTAIAFDAVDPASVSLSFGYNALTGKQVFRKKVQVRNYAASARTFTITPSFRYADDAASGAVSFTLPASVAVPANGVATIAMSMNVDASKLPTWTVNGGSGGGNGPSLQRAEFDGYLTLVDGRETLSLPWHLLAHKAANTRANVTSLALNGATGKLPLANPGGAVAGDVDIFALTGTSDRYPANVLPQPGDNFAVIDLKAVGVYDDLDADVIAFGINTWGSRAHPVYPAGFEIDIDTNGDGDPDFAIYNSEAGGFAVTGQTLVNVLNLHTNVTQAFYYMDATFNSANVIMYAPLSVLGLVSGQKINFQVIAYDSYFTGLVTDFITDMKYTIGKPRFVVDNPFPTVPVDSTVLLDVTAPAGGTAASPSQSGLLLLYRDGKPGSEAGLVTVTP